MSNQEILEKAIQKAIDGGWDVFETECHQITVFEATSEMRDDEDHYYFDAPHNGLIVDIRRRGYWGYKEVIYNHDFAKALWGEKIVEEWYDDGGEIHNFMGGTIEYPYDEGAGIVYEVAKWKLHLQQMVIAEDPIKYLEENI